MSAQPDTGPDDVLRSAAAGGRAARGGLARVAAYAAGVALTAGASAVLLRHLGVAAFGRYATVVALVTIAGGVADAGLTVVGQREYVLADAEGRRRLLGTVAALRLVLAPAGVLAAALFALAAGHPGEMVLGTLVAGAGVVCSSLAVSVAMPLGAQLRLHAVAATELTRQAVAAVAIVGLVAAGARLPEIFLAQLIAGAAMLAATVAVSRATVVAPRFEIAACVALARRAAAVGLSLVLGVVYVRVLVVLVFLIGTGVEAGLYGTSSRVLELVGAVPWLLVGSAFPILAHAGAADEARLRGALRRLADAGLVLAGVLVVGLGLAAGPIVELLGGDEFARAATVLQIQCALVPALFLTQTWCGALVAVGAQRAVVAVNATGLIAVLVLGAALIAPFGAEGAAVAAVAGEWGVALVAALLLRRARPELRPGLGTAWKPALAVAAGIGAGIASGLPDVAAAAAGCAVYVAVAAALGALRGVLASR